MSTSPSSSEQSQPRDAASWAQEASTLVVARTPTGVLNLNVEGHQLLSPLNGHARHPFL
jgi:hypothetical protein